MKRLLLIAFGLAAALPSRPSRAAQQPVPLSLEEQQSELCSAAVLRAEQQYGTPPGPAHLHCQGRERSPYNRCGNVTALALGTQC